MEETTLVSQLICDVYDAAIDRTLWSPVLQTTCHFVGAMSGAVLADDSVQRDVRFFFEWGNDPHYLAQFHETYARLNPLTIPTLLYAEVGAVLASADVVPYEEMIGSRFFKEWATPQGIVDAISAVLDKTATSFALLALHRHRTQGRVDDEMRRRLKLLAPHFRRAVSIGKVIDLHKVEAAALADTLDGLATATFLVDGSARIVHANRRGSELLFEAKVLHAPGGRLAAVDAKPEQSLKGALTAAAAGDQELGTRGIALLLATIGDGNWIAHILPLTSGARRRAGQCYAATAAVFVRKAGLDLPSPVETLAKAYKLTPAEVRVLFASMEVGGVPEVAALLGVSEPTVRTHTQRIFSKVGVKRQADLVKLVAAYMSPLNA